MPPNEESMKIANVFTKYSKTGDKSLIEDIPENKLELTLMQYAADKGFSHHVAMEMRLNELKEKRKSKHAQANKWWDRIIGFILGILTTLICGYLKNILRLN